MRYVAFSFLLILQSMLCCGQMTTPSKVTMCDLYEHPERYLGMMIEVRANVTSHDLALEDFSNEKPCPSYMRLHLEFPNSVKPPTAFDVVRNEAYDQLFKYLHRGMNVEATFTGRFDPVFVWRNHQRMRVSNGADQGYGKKNKFDGRIVLMSISDVLARPMPRR